MTHFKIGVSPDQFGNFPETIRLPVTYSPFGDDRKPVIVTARGLQKRVRTTFKNGVSYILFPYQVTQYHGPKKYTISTTKGVICNSVTVYVKPTRVATAFCPSLSFSVRKTPFSRSVKVRLPIVIERSASKMTVKVSIEGNNFNFNATKDDVEVFHGVAAPSFSFPGLNKGIYSVLIKAGGESNRHTLNVK